MEPRGTNSIYLPCKMRFPPSLLWKLPTSRQRGFHGTDATGPGGSRTEKGSRAVEIAGSHEAFEVDWQTRCPRRDQRHLVQGTSQVLVEESRSLSFDEEARARA